MKCILKNTMKINILFFLITSFTFGQNIISGKFEMKESIINKAEKLEYNFTTNNAQGLIKNDMITIYKTENFIYQKTTFDNKKYTEEELTSINSSIIVIQDEIRDEKYNEILIELPTRKLTEYTREIYFLESDYAVVENLPTMQWTLQSEQKQIGNFLCEKAKTTFRGRTYEVWYTSEIPINYGPWKFNGLPGLMVEIKDTQGIYTWQLTSFTPNIEIGIGLNEIHKKNSKFEIVSFKDFDEAIINKRQNNFLMISSRNENPNVKFSFDTYQDIEPINEWRTQTRWEF